MIGPVLVLWRAEVEGQASVMLRVHAACVHEVWEELHVCAATVEGCKIEDARFEIGAIDLIGPMATEALFAILKVGKGESAKVWNQLRGLSDPMSLPLGAVLDLDLRDPRIEYPNPPIQKR
jgi:ribonuclease P/MRP protein subunit POP1